MHNKYLLTKWILYKKSVKNTHLKDNNNHQLLSRITVQDDVYVKVLELTIICTIIFLVETIVKQWSFPNNKKQILWTFKKKV